MSFFLSIIALGQPRTWTSHSMNVCHGMLQCMRSFQSVFVKAVCFMTGVTQRSESILEQLTTSSKHLRPSSHRYRFGL
ncbi:hypothetical protein E4T56_gene18971 [Termitomyces sp. T112]|nr:hypothetical protein E4T56_gene18971 [Termitomyces sp. T112]